MSYQLVRSILLPSLISAHNSDILALHPYYKLHYIERAWGGAKEQEQEILAGNPDAKNWHDEARKILEDTVRNSPSFIQLVITYLQMRAYWKTRPRTNLDDEPMDVDDDAHSALPHDPSIFISDFDRYRQTLVSRDDDEGWESELRRYLKSIPAEMKKDIDLVRLWSVCIFLYIYCSLL